MRAGGEIGEIFSWRIFLCVGYEGKYHNVAARLSQGGHKVITGHKVHAWLSQPGSLVTIPHPQKEERVWYTLSAFWGAQDAACHVIIMTRHRFGMAMHQWLSRAAIVVVSHANHMQATWRESDWHVNIQKQAPESARCIPDHLLLLGVGSGDETTIGI